MKWPFKDPDEIQDYTVDWSRFLNAHTINSVAWFVRAADGTKTSISATETVAVTYNSSLVAERVIQLPIKER